MFGALDIVGSIFQKVAPGIEGIINATKGNTGTNASTGSNANSTNTGTGHTPSSGVTINNYYDAPPVKN